VAGVELQAAYEPNWAYFYPQTVQNAQALGADWFVLTPTWTYQRTTPLEFGLDPEHDQFWLDSAILVSQARAANLNVVIFPQPNFIGSAADFWRAAPRDNGWWQTWFEHYRAFAVNYADLAAQTGSQALVLGGDWLDPALPGGLLDDGTGSGVPEDAAARWTAIIVEARKHFSGKIWWAMPFTPGHLPPSLDFVASTDGVYLLWDAALASDATASKSDMVERAGQLLDNEVAPMSSVFEKPVILALAYPSADGVKTGCFSNGSSGCLNWTALDEPYNAPTVNVALQAQADVYEAILTAINSRPYVAGIVSRGFYPPAILQDKSASVHGKPAADLLWYWFPRLTGTVQ
jgi:hypothetical protein